MFWMPDACIITMLQFRAMLETLRLQSKKRWATTARPRRRRVCGRRQPGWAGPAVQRAHADARQHGHSRAWARPSPPWTSPYDGKWVLATTAAYLMVVLTTYKARRPER